MPRNGSGTYTLAQAAFVNGTVADATAVNSDLNDIASALTFSIAKDGQTPPTANLPMGNFKLTGLGAGTTAGDSLAFGQTIAATTAATLATPRAINGVNFDGSAAITVADATKLPLAGGTLTGTLAVNTVPQAIAQFNSTNASGGFVQVQSSGSTQGYVGSSKALVSGAAAATSLAVRSEAELYLSANGGSNSVILDTTGSVGIGLVPPATYGAVSLWAGGAIVATTSQFDVHTTVGATPYQFVGRHTGGFQFYTAAGTLVPFTITNAGLLQDINNNELGYKGLPAASVTTGAFTASDRGKCVNATGGVTVPNSTMAAGDVVTIDNTTGSAITITATITTLTLAGTTSTGSRTLAANGLCTIKFRSPTSALISGVGLS